MSTAQGRPAKARSKASSRVTVFPPAWLSAARLPGTASPGAFSTHQLAAFRQRLPPQQTATSTLAGPPRRGIGYHAALPAVAPARSAIPYACQSLRALAVSNPHSGKKHYCCPIALQWRQFCLCPSPASADYTSPKSSRNCPQIVRVYP